MQESIDTLQRIPGVNSIERIYPTTLDSEGQFTDRSEPLPWGLIVSGSDLIKPENEAQFEAICKKTDLLAIIDETTSIDTALQVERERSMGWHIDGGYEMNLPQIRDLKKDKDNPPRLTRTGFARMNDSEFEKIFWEEVAKSLKMDAQELIREIRGFPLIDSILSTGRADLQSFADIDPTIPSEETAQLLNFETRYRSIKDSSIMQLCSLYLSSSDFLERVNTRLMETQASYFHDYNRAGSHRIMWKDTNKSSSSEPHMIHCAWYKED